jgi:membrane fusion protein
MSRTDFNSKYASYTDDLISLERMRADSNDRMREIQDLEYQVKRLPYALKERLSTMELEISDAQRRLSELSASGTFAVKAPIGGRVTNILGRVGAHVDRDVLLVMILPRQFHLKAELYVPTRIISFVNPGQSVKVRYDAFPYQKFGYYCGHVESVSQSVLKDDELHTNVKLDEAVYRVIVVLDEQTVSASGKQLSLQPGMFLEAYLAGERRSLLEWIFEPLLGVKNRYAL